MILRKMVGSGQAVGLELRNEGCMVCTRMKDDAVRFDCG
jgi:hypothetical protein